MSEWYDNEAYYSFHKDLEKYPDAWCYVVWSRRGPGKTYSVLRYAYEHNIPIAYGKRTNKDIDMICTYSSGVDLSPYYPINRDAGYTIHPKLIKEGVGAFYDEVTAEGQPCGAPIAYCVSLNAVKVVKGFDLSHVEWFVMDEFIPLKGERVLQAEGDQLMSMYMTLLRDRPKRGLPATKLILFANAESIATPITNELEIVDDIANLTASGRTHQYLKDRGILLHHITEEEVPITEEEKTGIYKALGQTAWGRKAFGGDFSSVDFSCVQHVRMKGYRPVCAYIYKDKKHFIYRKGKKFHVTRAAGKAETVYDFSRESDQRLFWFDWQVDIKLAHMDGDLTCELYSEYDLLINFKKYFKVV